MLLLTDLIDNPFGENKVRLVLHITYKNNFLMDLKALCKTKST